ncbi:DUF3093 domain-containing protein [Microbacterium sp. cx-59]|uniref:DUF3093 domain-containing protein n=1 Tax=Microbacterium sp. cx-59 TaxID=2891207 RepID=UPI001E630E69|nr:DUF3093 domain-containing protein [Microbacterium sp. cx-59]MCC4907300.1 DUF3093 domain-containing protein [Microbacterium sp. cx-59]
MQIMHVNTRSPAPVYREKLSPSLWTLVAAALGAPMIALALSPVDLTLALIGGVAVSAVIIALLIWLSPSVSVADGELRAGRAHIDVALLGDAEALAGEEARTARGREFDPRSWTLVRGGIDGAVRIAVLDANDPAPFWIISSRTPDRLAAALRRAQSYAAHSMQM